MVQQPMSIVLSDELARQLFGSEEPMGKVVNVTGGFYFVGDFVVRGVMANISEASSLKYEMLITGFTGQPIQKKKIWEGWVPTQNWPRVFNFVLLKPNANAKDLETKLGKMISQYIGDEVSKTYTYHLQPLTRIYLYSKTDYNVNRMVAEDINLTGDIRDISMLSAIAGFILFIACINFMNLTTARSARRAKEVGLRKVIGANRIELVGQFLGEAFLMVGIALILALGLIEIIKPYFATFMGKTHLSSGFFSPTQVAMGVMGILL
ncbi:MAG: FtsX-like permease family protein, partial [Candidatus Latescibacteria bacterium]|nr:FtsX-like permease family protein [Candidatus Latescibacterota bacterium]